MQFNITPLGLKEAIKNMDNMAKKQVPFATAKALTNTAQAVKEELIKEMTRVFDRPTPFTLNSLVVIMATKTNLKAEVQTKFPPRLSQKQHYLEPQIKGGSREYKEFEKALHCIGVLPSDMTAIPGKGAKLDAYGNMSRGEIVKILSYFKAFGEQGYKANITEAKKKRLAKGSKKKIGYTYIVLRKPRGRLPAGIYQRFSFAIGNALRLILIFTKKPTYKKRWMFNEIAQKVVTKEFMKKFSEAMEYAINTAK